VDDPQETDIGETDDAQTMAFGASGESVGMVRRHFLVVVSGPEPGRRIEISDQPMTLGRKAQANVRLHDAKVSGVHCRIQLIMDQLVVNDLNSTNGTFVEGQRVGENGVAPIGALLHIGAYVLKHEVLCIEELERTQERETDLRAAAEYVRSLLPPPLRDGSVQTEWIYLPSAALGGDAFGYHRLADGQFSIYLLDVCGHGTGPAMHSVSVLNVLSQESLPHTDFRDPGAVLDSLNRIFSMHDHAGLYFTCWYGVFDPATRSLRFASGGHPPGFLVSQDGMEIVPLQTHNPGVGLIPGAAFGSERIDVETGSRMYLYSDGAYEFRPKGRDHDWTLEDFKSLLAAPSIDGISEAHRIHQSIMEAASGDLVDDFSLLVVRFA
jgi:hypothetical protein